jgi:broad specificity phosphatase PhoE
VRPPSSRLLLVRHGESTWNAEGRWQGQADPPLSAAGERQARAATAPLDGLDLDGVWSSDLARAARTAAILAGSDRPVHLEPGLRERDVGAWAGLTRDELDATHPGWSSDGWRPDGWEDDDALAARCRPALDEVAASLGDGGTALVVSHGGVIRALESTLGRAPHPVPNLGGVWLHAVDHEWSLGSRVALLEVEALALDPTPGA